MDNYKILLNDLDKGTLLKDLLLDMGFIVCSEESNTNIEDVHSFYTSSFSNKTIDFMPKLYGGDHAYSKNYFYKVSELEEIPLDEFYNKVMRVKDPIYQSIKEIEDLDSYLLSLEEDLITNDIELKI